MSKCGLRVLPGKMSPHPSDNSSLAPWNCVGTPGSRLNHRESVGCRVGAACRVMTNLNKALMLGRQWEPPPHRPLPLPCCVTQGKPLALSEGLLRTEAPRQSPSLGPVCLEGEGQGCLLSPRRRNVSPALLGVLWRVETQELPFPELWGPHAISQAGLWLIKEGSEFSGVGRQERPSASSL